MTKVKQQGRVVEMKPGCPRTGAEPMRPKTKAKPNRKRSPSEAEGQVTDEGLEVHGDNRAMTDQCKASRMRKPGGAIGMTAPGEAEGARSQGGVRGCYSILICAASFPFLAS